MLHCVGMRLAPRIFMRADVGRFAKIGGSRILRRDSDQSISTRIRCDTLSWLWPL